MLPLDDPAWKVLEGGYKVPYDASLALRRLEAGENAWDELWQELHHQGDVGQASYAAVPHIVRIAALRRRGSWHPYALVSVIEVERHHKRNPPLDPTLEAPYARAIQALGELALSELPDASDPLLIRSALGAIALSKRLPKIGAFLAMEDESEIDAYMEDRYAWSEVYTNAWPKALVT